MAVPVTHQVTIANAATVSGATQDLGEFTVVGIEMPAAFTGTALTFQVSRDGTTFQQLTKDDGTAYTATVAAAKDVALDYTKFVGWRWVKAVSGSAEGGSRILTFTLRAL